MTLEEKLAKKNALGTRVRNPMPEFMHKYEETTDTVDTTIATREGDTHVYIVSPKVKDAAKGLYVNIHGGGFIAPHRPDDTAYCRRIVSEIGCVCVDIDYRLAPDYPYPTAFHECYDVVKYMLAHAAEYGFDPNVLMIGGNSAGGNLTAGVCLEGIRTGDFKPILAVMLYPVLDLYTDPAIKQKDNVDAIIPPDRARTYNLMYVDDDKRKQEFTASPIFAPAELLAKMPECVIYTAEHDSLKVEGEEFALKLARAGINVTCKRWLGCNHGFYFDYLPATYACIELVERAMRNALTSHAQTGAETEKQ